MKICLSALVLALTAISIFSSCKKEEDEGKLPNISFKSGTGYTAADATIAKKTDVKIGINASKSEDKDVLTKFTITRSIDGGADSILLSKDLSGGEGDTYSYDYTTTTPDKVEKEKYTFTVVNRDGLVNKVSLTINVQ